jgi:hypothetical protein
MLSIHAIQRRNQRTQASAAVGPVVSSGEVYQDHFTATTIPQEAWLKVTARHEQCPAVAPLGGALTEPSHFSLMTPDQVGVEPIGIPGTLLTLCSTPWIERACEALLPGSPDPAKDRRIDEASVERLDQRHGKRGEPGHELHIDRPVQTIAAGRLGEHGRQEGVHRRVPHLCQRLSPARTRHGTVRPVHRGQSRTTCDVAAEPMERQRLLVHVHVRVPATQPSQQCTQREEAAYEGFAARTCSRARSARTSAIVRSAPPPGRSTAVTSWSGTARKREWIARRRRRNCSRGKRILWDPPSLVVWRRSAVMPGGPPTAGRRIDAKRPRLRVLILAL